MTIVTYRNTSPVIGENVYIDNSAVVIGEVTLEKDVSVWPTVVIRGDVNSILVQQGTNIQDGSVLHVTHDGTYSPGGYPLAIGQGVTIGHRAVVHACTVGNECLIGVGAIIMDGAVVEDHVLLGAGSLVPPGKRLNKGYLYVGSPAKQIRILTDDELAFLRYSYEHYILLKNSYLDNCC